MDRWASILCLPDVSPVGISGKMVIDFLLGVERWLDGNISREALIATPALFVALLVPIAFFLMERQDLYGFDKNVILDKIILAKWSIPLVFLVSISLLFNITTLSTLLATLLVVMISIVLIRVYKWTVSVEILKYKTTYKQDIRLKFIRAIKNDIEKVDTWAIILNDENLLEKNQRGLVTEFVAAVKSLQDGKNKYPQSNLLGLMSRNVGKIDFADVQSYETLVSFSIEYFQQVRDAREKNKQANDKTDRVAYPPYYKRELALNLLKIALNKKANDIFDYIYFSTIKKYVARSDVDEAGFIRDFLPSYIRLVKENDTYDAESLWQELSDWVVTQELLSKEESWPKAISLLNAYMESVGRQARTDAELLPREVQVIDDVTRLLLPNINVSFWFDIVTFYSDGWGLDEGEDSMHGQIRSHVSRRRDFGLFNTLGDTRGWIDDEQERLKAYEAEFQRQDEETIHILGLLFRWLYNPKETQKVLDQIKIIVDENLFEADSHESRQLESLKNRFEKIQTYTAKIVAEQNKKKQGK